MPDQPAEKVQQVSVDELQANPLRPRGVITPESLTDLVDSIKVHGVLEPLLVAKTPAGLQIIAGERRWRAAKIAGLKTVPCIVKETTPRGMLEMALVENVQRVDLHPLERAKAFKRLTEEFGLGTTQIARRIGKSPAFISNSLKLLTLPDALKDGLLTGAISEGHARALAQIDDPRLMIEAYKIILREQATVRQAEALARKMAAATQPKKGSKDLSRSLKFAHEEIEEMRKEIRRVVASWGVENPRVRLIRSRTTTKLVIILPGGLGETEQALQRIYRGIMSQEE